MVNGGGKKTLLRSSLASACLLGLIFAGSRDGWGQEQPDPAAPAEAPPAPTHESGVHFATGGTAFRIAGFGDADFVAPTAEGENSAFSIGPVVLYMTARMSDHWSALVELVFESDGNTLVTDLERFVVSYEYSDRLRLDLGRHHNSLVRWNVTQHHGLFHQTPVERPAMARFEDQPGLWPVHFVGLRASGRLQDRFGLRYEVGVGNGRGQILDEVQVGGDANGSKAIVASLGFAPAFSPGWELYFTGYFDRIPATDGELREQDFTVSTSYLARGLEVRAEWGRMQHTPEGASFDYRTTGWYVLVSRRLPGRWDFLRPYLFLDHLEVAKGERFLEGVPDEASWTGGLRFDLNAGTAVKAEYRSQKIGAGEHDGVVRAQVAVAF